MVFVQRVRDIFKTNKEKLVTYTKMFYIGNTRVYETTSKYKFKNHAIAGDNWIVSVYWRADNTPAFDKLNDLREYLGI